MTVEMVGWRWAADVILAVSRSRGEGFRVVSELEASRHHVQTSRLPTTPDCLRPVACYFIPWVWDLFSLLYVIVGAQLHARSYARSHATASAQLHAHNEK
jgi:hypothetical protein